MGGERPEMSSDQSRSPGDDGTQPDKEGETKGEGGRLSPTSIRQSLIPSLYIFR